MAPVPGSLGQLPLRPWCHQRVSHFPESHAAASHGEPRDSITSYRKILSSIRTDACRRSGPWVVSKQSDKTERRGMEGGVMHLAQPCQGSSEGMLSSSGFLSRRSTSRSRVSATSPTVRATMMTLFRSSFRLRVHPPETRHFSKRRT